MDILSLKADISTLLHDPAQQVFVTAQILRFINDAARDATLGGWLVDLNDDATLAFDGGTDYTVPVDFDHIVELSTPGVFPGSKNLLLPHEWELVLEGDLSLIRFDLRFASALDGETITIVGFRNPAVYTADDDVVDVGMEAFLRERAKAYGAQYGGRSGSQWARAYEQLFQDSFTVSEEMLTKQLGRQQARLKKYLVLRQVPGR